MMPLLQPGPRLAVPAALRRALRHLLLQEPAEAEVLCREVLRFDPANPRAATLLIRSLARQIRGLRTPEVALALEALALLPSAEERSYHSGLICEAQGRAVLEQGGPASGFRAFDSLHEAMRWYARVLEAGSVRSGEAGVRWQACAFLIQRHRLVGETEDAGEPFLE